MSKSLQSPQRIPSEIIIPPNKDMKMRSAKFSDPTAPKCISKSRIKSHQDRKLPARHSRGWEKTFSGDAKRRSWMKNFTMSSKDLIWGSCSEEEESFMAMSSPEKCLTPRVESSTMGLCESNTPESNHLSRMAATLSSISKETITTIGPPINNAHKGKLPRFRNDHVILGHEDVELVISSLQCQSRSALSYWGDMGCSSPDDSDIDELEMKKTAPFKQGMLESKFNGGRLDGGSARNGSSTTNPGCRGETPFANIQTTKATREETLDGYGSRVRIHDKDRVYKAMENGTAIVVECVGCEATMLATSDMELVFCPKCGTLSPFKLMKTGFLPSAGHKKEW